MTKREDVSDDPNQKPKTIYGELKLSDRLVTQLDTLKAELESTKIELQNKCQECDYLRKKAEKLSKQK